MTVPKTENHHQWLQPHQFISADDSQIEAAGQGTAAHGDGALQPAGAGQFQASFASGPATTTLRLENQVALLCCVWGGLVPANE